MNEKHYSLTEALELLIKKVTDFDQDLGKTLEVAITGGKDVLESEPPQDRRRKSQKYRKATPYSEEEAIGVALNVLKSAFIELPTIINETLKSFEEAEIVSTPAIRIRKRHILEEEKDTKKEPPKYSFQSPLAVDMTVETQLDSEQEDYAEIPWTDINGLNEVSTLIKELEYLIKHQE